MMPPGVRKLALTVHVACSIGWLGAVACFLVLAVAGLGGRLTAYPSMDLLARYVLVPLALGSLLTGLVQSLGTTWGLFRHYWVVVKLAVTVVATAVLLLQLDPIAALAADPGSAREAKWSLVVHSGGGLLVLLVPTVLSVYKPPGFTRYGRRRRGA